jgi:hypothetical protein
MSKEPITDHDELIRREVDLRMKPIITANLEGQERLYLKMDRIEKLIMRQYDVRTHAYVNSLAIAGLAIFMLALLAG